MSEDRVVADILQMDASADLEAVLDAWHTATVRLEQTHEALREEVRRLTDELEVKNRELARKKRLADLGQMASHVAHEVRNNLVPVTLYLSLLRRRVSDDQGSLDVLLKIEAGFAALNVTVNDLLHFTSERDPQLQSFPVAKLVEEVYGTLAPQLSAQSIRTRNKVDTRLCVTADRDMLRRAVLNLVLNAVDAMPEGGTLSVSTASRPTGIDLVVADTGHGLSEEAQRRAFEPFFTTKRGGTGLGLAIVYRIAEVHGGRIAAANAPSGGAVFTFTLPRPIQEAAA